MRRIIVVTLLGLLTACGSSGSEDEASAGKPTPSPSVVAVEPAQVVPLVAASGSPDPDAVLRRRRPGRGGGLDLGEVGARLRHPRRSTDQQGP